MECRDFSAKHVLMTRTHKDERRGWSFKARVPSWFKKMQKKKRKAKEKQAVRTGKEPPLSKKSDHWDWW